jgi:hypothetical protein
MRRRTTAQYLSGARRSFIFGKKTNEENSERAPRTTETPKMPSFSSFQDMLKAGPDKQLEMMKQAMEYQKKFSNVPGLKKLTEKQLQMMEKIINMHESMAGKKNTPQDPEVQREVLQFLEEQKKSIESNPPPPPPPSSSKSPQSPSVPSKTGPTLDELQKINLGPEIEELFAELRRLRTKKNEYRDKFNAREVEVEGLRKEAEAAQSSVVSLRTKLAKSEHEVMLLNSEVMDLKEASKELKALQKSNRLLKEQVTALQGNDVTALSEKNRLLEQELREKEESVRSLTRKLERARKGDPMHHDVLVVNQLLYIASPTAPVALRDHVEIFSKTARDEYYNVWVHKALKEHHLSSNAFAQWVTTVMKGVLRRFIPNAHLDAIVLVDMKTCEGMSTEKIAVQLSRDSGFTCRHLEGNEFEVSLPGDATSPIDLGPYGYCAAVARIPSADKRICIEKARPVITEVLLDNHRRCTVDTFASRSSGPGGQAANVGETQITCRVAIDGGFEYQTEAQDSRSALANKETAMGKLRNEKLKLHNQHLAQTSKPRFDELEDVLKAELDSLKPVKLVYSLTQETLWGSLICEYYNRLLVKLGLSFQEASLGDPTNAP